MRIAELLNEQNPADQIAKDAALIAQHQRQQWIAQQQGGDKPAPGTITASQIYNHPKWLATSRAMHQKYPTNKDQAMQAAKDAITQLIKQGQ